MTVLGFPLIRKQNKDRLLVHVNKSKIFIDLQTKIIKIFNIKPSKLHYRDTVLYSTVI